MLAVLIAALGGFFMGAVWYMALAKPWMAAAGIATTPDGKPVKGPSPMPFIVAGVAMIFVAGMMRHMFSMAGIDGGGKGLLAGAGLGLFVISPWTAMNYAYANRPRALTLIDGGYAVLGCAVIGLILGLL